ncbi:MAG: mannose-6-phosphate isomerase-like protein (cupin superfamily) [Oceanicoccus sp.]|jgi:mannose-6-phosphate isomerase-like protein (cupin superfamily)
MKTYPKSGSHLFCGHLNGSPVEIGLTELLLEVPLTESLHYHDYHEYCVILEGSGDLEVEGSVIPLFAGPTIMVQPGERHRVVAVGPSGIGWVIIKERSEPNSKHEV